jgi:hypothetical protein
MRSPRHCRDLKKASVCSLLPAGEIGAYQGTPSIEPRAARPGRSAGLQARVTGRPLRALAPAPYPRPCNLTSGTETVSGHGFSRAEKTRRKVLPCCRRPSLGSPSRFSVMGGVTDKRSRLQPDRDSIRAAPSPSQRKTCQGTASAVPKIAP